MCTLPASPQTRRSSPPSRVRTRAVVVLASCALAAPASADDTPGLQDGESRNLLVGTPDNDGVSDREVDLFANDGVDGDEGLDGAIGLEDFDDGDPGADELFLFEDIPVVVTSSRRAQPINQSSLAISIIGAEQIRRGGFDTIPDALRFSVGMDVLASDRNNFSVGVRGLHHPFGDRTLVLIEGRNASGANSGATDFTRLPLFLDDIERIEIARGPASAAWGANALNGAINIILKDPKDVQGIFSATKVNDFGDVQQHVRWAESAGDWSWRVSAGFDDREASSDANSDDDFLSNDFSRDFRLDAEAHRSLDDDARLKFGAAYFHGRRGAIEFAGVPTPGATLDETLDVVRLFGRWEKDFSDGRSAYAQWFTHIDDIDRPSLWNYETYESDLEVQFNTPLGEANNLSVGANARWVQIHSHRRAPTDLTPTDEESEIWLGLFAIDRWDLSDSFALEGQLRVDWYSETKVDWSGRLSALFAIDEAQHHRLRLGIARAFRAPFYGIRRFAGQRIPLPSPPFPAGLFGINIVEPVDLDHEQTHSVEIGYDGRIGSNVLVGVQAYATDYDDLIGTAVSGAPFGTGPAVFQLANLGGGSALGLETTATYTAESLSISAWYALNVFDSSRAGQSTRSFEPARHKLGLSASLDLPKEFGLHCNYLFVNTTENDAANTVSGPVSSFHRLDMTASKSFADGRAEALVGVLDMLDATDLTVGAFGMLGPHKTPGRTFVLQVRLNF